MILVVDDEPWIVEEMLEAFEYLGEVAIGAHDIDSATAIIESHGDIDMVFTDIRMPGGSGWELVERFDNPSPDTPKFVVITGHEDEYSHAASNGQAKGENVVSFLTKPIAVHQLQEILLAQKTSTTQGSTGKET